MLLKAYGTLTYKITQKQYYTQATERKKRQIMDYGYPKISLEISEP